MDKTVTTRAVVGTPHLAPYIEGLALLAAATKCAIGFGDIHLGRIDRNLAGA